MTARRRSAPTNALTQLTNVLRTRRTELVLYEVSTVMRGFPGHLLLGRSGRLAL